MITRCKICNKKIREFKGKSFDYCLDCLPNNLRCDLVYKQGKRCRSPIEARGLSKCLMHSKNPFIYGICIGYTKRGRKCRASAISESGYCKHHYNSRRYLPKEEKRNKDNSLGEIYVFNLGFDGLYKIGMSLSGWEQRLQSLRAGNPKMFCEFVYEGAANTNETEKYIHKKLDRYKVEREIFRLYPRHLETIQKYLKSREYTKIA